MKRFFTMTVLLTLAAIAFSCQKVEKEYNVPYVSTLEATDITDGEATIRGSYSGLKGFDYGSLNIYFVISTDKSVLDSYDRFNEYGDEIIEVSGWEKRATPSASYESDLSGLAPSTTYYYFFAIYDAYSEARGQIHSFTTDEVDPEILDVTLYDDYYYSNGSVYYDVEVETNVDLSSYKGNYGIWVYVRGKSGSSEEFYPCNNSGKVLTAQVKIPKDAFDIDNSSYYCTAEVMYCKIGIYKGTQVLCSAKVDGITYEKQPSIEIVSVEQGNTVANDDETLDKVTHYDYTIQVNGLLFIDEVYTYLIGTWKTEGKHKIRYVDTEGLWEDNGWSFEFSSTSTGSTSNYKQIRAMVGNREIKSENYIRFYLDGPECYISLYTGYVSETSSVKSNAMRLSVVKDSNDFSCTPLN